MKKTLSLMLAVLFCFTAFGVTTVFGGVFTAGAEFLDYFKYEAIPGLGAFSEDAWKSSDQHAMAFESFSTECTPAGDYEGKIAKFTVTSTDEWGGAGFRTNNREWTPEVDPVGYNWAAMGYIDGTTIFGDTGLTFEDATGFTFWVGVDGENYKDTVKVTMAQVPSKGPYYNLGGELSDRPVGCLYECPQKQVDVDGYVYFDFKTDFTQVDWWSTDDEGINQSGVPNTPIPKKALPLLNGMQIRLASGFQVGSSIYVGDFRLCYDTRIHTDELDEQITVFDSLDPEAYTEESYIFASEAYFKAYEVFLEPESQKQVDAATAELKAALKALKPLFHAANKDIVLEGINTWTDEDLDEISGIGADSAMFDTDTVPANADKSVMIMANAMQGPPTYGWSWFTNGDADVAVGNPFALVGDSAPLSEANGIRFWVKWDEMLTPPERVRIGLGNSTDGVYFETDEISVSVPENGGYLGAAWSAFYDMEGEEDIFDHIDSLDYISIMFIDAVGIYYLSDIQAFNWSASSADFDALIEKIDEINAYLDTLNEDDWYPISWDRVVEAIAAGEALLNKYGVTQDEVDNAKAAIETNVNKLVRIGDLATRETLNKLEALYAAGKSYWRGNVTPASYREFMPLVANAGQLIEDGPKEEVAQAAIAELDAAINNLVPIKAGEKVTSIYSFESYNNRDLNKANGDRTEGVVYSLVTPEDVPTIPEGYAKALKMVATEDVAADNKDEHGVMQFKAMSRDTGHVVPIKIGPNGENTLMGDLTGTDGICLWVGVNDVNLVQDCSFRFAVSNCTISPLFERAAHNIPLPSTGSGWIYIPWEYFEFYDDWTNGEEIRLNEIFFYILRFNGVVKQGLEVYVTGIHAYKNTTNGTWNTPTLNITEGQQIDISEGGFMPVWSEGSAILDGVNFIYGNKIISNGDHVIEVRNGDKKVTVNFSTTGGEVYTVPVVSGVEDGGEYTAATITWDVGTATLNGEAVENGVEITELGRYTLVVTNGDKTTEITFRIIDKPANDKGDFDGDGELTVADALAALRIAARMAESSDEAIAIGDIDADGEITVADALAILRVAAKMSDSL